jgi:hypothetical protein
MNRRSRVQECNVVCKRAWDGLEMIQYHLELSTVVQLAREQFNDLEAPGTSECSIREFF